MIFAISLDECEMKALFKYFKIGENGFEIRFIEIETKYNIKYIRL